MTNDTLQRAVRRNWQQRFFVEVAPQQRNGSGGISKCNCNCVSANCRYRINGTTLASLNRAGERINLAALADPS